MGDQMTTITPTISMHDKHGQRQYIYEYALPSVPVSTTSGKLKLDQMPKHGKIDQINISSLSDDFDLSLFDKPTCIYHSINEILAYEEMDNNYERVDVNLQYDNAESPRVDALYARIKNDDAVNATGTVSLKIHVTDLR